MKKNKGYTMIELLVALSIFVIVVVVVLGLFSTAIKGQRKVISQQNVQENARFLLEFMAKEIRMSTITSGNGTSGSLTLIRSDGDSVTYSVVSGKIYRNSGQVSSDEVMVIGNFYVEGVGAGISDNQQPKVVIALEVQGVGTKAEEQSKINIQTTLSQRNLDL